ncbi:hypothetical protein OHU11_30635 [Streptomyces sp. NBC_00257]|uniref:hypothetical protein n=1 Tax=unclassified Streptomyces TaxID=2593676 RepID=UPI00225040E1|nr:MULTISPECIES: hypothetical protein [unclassified Streptomyces]MCX4867396.1 hypothetical protein [Streptomyces sp. NBC_00906]MCX4898634.1 hypothetical protein [Streptomyces sp. NBC_00892]MCX5432013.1 hypothetical protein [Streptomyces sp. NBC_00062]
MSVRVGRWAVGGVVVAEVVLVGCLSAGVRVPAAALLGARVSAVVMLGFEAVVLGRLLRAGRRAGLGWREALAAALRTVVPERARRLAAHEVRALHSLGLWLRGRRHGVPVGAVAVAYTGPQTAMMYGLLFVSVVETVMLALLIPWPLVHGILLVLDVYGVVFVLALHASCVTRPHVVDADGALRLRYGGLFDLRIPAGAVAGARVERRFPEGGPVRAGADGVLDLVVGGQTTVRVELTAPVEFVRPLGKRGQARAVRFHADDPGAVVAALGRGRGREDAG